MKEQPKDYTSTILRMAGNIAPAVLTMQLAQSLSPEDVARCALDYAEAIVSEAMNRKAEARNG